MGKFFGGPLRTLIVIMQCFYVFYFGFTSGGVYLIKIDSNESSIYNPLNI